MYHQRQCTVPAVNDSHTTDFVVMTTLQHLGHCFCSDCPGHCGYNVNSYDLTIIYLSTILSVHTSGSVACLHLFHIIKPTCADCEKPREDSKVGSHQGARRGCLPSPEFARNANFLFHVESHLNPTKIHIVMNRQVLLGATSFGKDFIPGKTS